MDAPRKIAIVRCVSLNDKKKIIVDIGLDGIQSYVCDSMASQWNLYKFQHKHRYVQIVMEKYSHFIHLQCHQAKPKASNRS